ncbi:MAG: helix-turn-helix transcriptional regulator [Proteobacteria bacterium]|nr:helix-turn-helix transcriptional regulator [Pseudomonadota bacterium]
MNEEKILQLFGEHVKKLRLQKKLSQEQLALLAELDRTYISGIERGKRNVSLINLIKLASSLDIPTHEIISFKLSNQNNGK